MFRRLLEEFKAFLKGPPPPPTALEAWRRLDKLVEDLDSIGFYLHQVSGFRPHSAFGEFMEKSEFHLTSARDELKIYLNNEEQLEKIANMGKPPL